jgi:spore coat protein U-like protein
MKKVVIPSAFILVLAFPAFTGISMAATKTNNLQVTASVAANCVITGVTDIAFGIYDPTSPTPLDVNGDLTFRCTKKTSYKTYITGARQMIGAGSSDSLSFELFSDPDRIIYYPADNSGSSTVAGSNSPITSIIYGRIPPARMCQRTPIRKV